MSIDNATLDLAKSQLIFRKYEQKRYEKKFLGSSINLESTLIY